MHRRYDIDHSAVASDIIDGEAVILHHPSGDYFSTDGIGAVIWRWIGEAKSHDQILGALKARFPQSADETAAALDTFLGDALKHGLVREIDLSPAAGPMPDTSLRSSPDLGEAFVPPVLHVYTDMRDVLLVDPIHEVEEASGWPVLKRPQPKP